MKYCSEKKVVWMYGGPRKPTDVLEDETTRITRSKEVHSGSQ